MDLLFLYTELSGYFASCIKELATRTGSIHIVRWQINAEAPFQFDFPENVTLYERNDYTTTQLIDLSKSINPNIIFSSGWIDRGYLKVCKHFKSKIPTIMCMDNQWFGSLKQRIWCIASPFILKKVYNYAWVPGTPQKEYAFQLGFSPKYVEDGYLSADVPLFASESKYRTEIETFPHRFIYVGRYIPVKGLDLLFEAFTELADELNNDWELWCAGTGEQFNLRKIHPKIKHFGFLQPTELSEQLRHAGVFVLPSRFEPWGVVVHEMAAAGFPMLCSSAVGAVSQFLENGKNGYIFKNGDKNELKEKMLKIMQTDDATLRKMANHSHQLGISYTPKDWAEKAMNFANI